MFKVSKRFGDWVTEEYVAYLTPIAERIMQGGLPPDNLKAPSGWWVKTSWTTRKDDPQHPHTVYFHTLGGSPGFIVSNR